MSLSGDNTSLLGQNFSWVKLVCDGFEQQRHRNSWRSARRTSVTTGCERFCRPIKGKSKTTKMIKNHAERRNWIDIEPEKHSLSECEISKKVIHLLRHSQKVHREDDGAVHFWRIKENLQNPFPQSIHWSDSRSKACLAAGGGAKRRFQHCTDASGTIVYFWALQGHSGRSFIAGQCCGSDQILPIHSFTILDVRSIFILSSTLD